MFGKYQGIPIQKPDNKSDLAYEIEALDEYERYNVASMSLCTGSTWCLKKFLDLRVKKLKKSYKKVKVPGPHDHLVEAIVNNAPNDNIRLLIAYGADLNSAHNFEKFSNIASWNKLDFAMKSVGYLPHMRVLIQEKILERGFRNCNTKILEELVINRGMPISHILSDTPFYVLDNYKFLKKHSPILLDRMGVGNTQIAIRMIAKSLMDNDLDMTALVMRKLPNETVQKLPIDWLLCQGVNFDVVGTFCTKYGLRSEDTLKTMTEQAITKGNLEIFQDWFKKAGYNIGDNESALLKAALKAYKTEIVDYMYQDLGASLTPSEVEDLPTSIARTKSKPVIDEIARQPEADEALVKIIKEMFQDTENSLEFFKYCYEKLSDDVAGDKHDIFRKALRSGSLDAVNYLLDKRASLSGLGTGALKDVVSRYDVKDLKTFVDRGLVFGTSLEPCLSYVRDNTKKIAFLKHLKNTEYQAAYPRWEKQDKNTAAEISFVRENGKGGALLLRRAFNFRAGTIDHCYEVHALDKAPEFLPSNSVPMDAFAQNSLIEVAKQELLTRDGEIPDMIKTPKGKSENVLNLPSSKRKL